MNGFSRRLVHRCAVLGMLTAALASRAAADDPHAGPVSASSAASIAECCAPSHDCGPNRLWGSAEYLLWTVKSAPLPVPLIATGPSRAGALNGPVLGEPGTQVLLGNESIDVPSLSGGRFTLGSWLDAAGTRGLEVTYFFLSQRSNTRALSAPGTPGSAALSIPFFDPTINAENSTSLADPVGRIAFAGTGVLSVDTRMQGGELNGVFGVARRERWQLQLLGGFRYVDLDEGLTFGTSSPALPPAAADVFVTQDHFFLRNDFYGGQLGARALFQTGRWLASITGKVALGDMHQRAHITGALATNDFNGFGPVQVFPGGYLALPTNIGTFSQDRFAVVPEAGVNVGYQLCRQAAFFAGYSFLYLSNVMRPGDQIDRVINPTQGPGFTGVVPSVLAGPARPVFLGETTDFFAHGVNFGLAFSF